jgi:hypothetical protein
MTVYLVVSLPKLLHTHRIYMVLANPKQERLTQSQSSTTAQRPLELGDSFFKASLLFIHSVFINLPYFIFFLIQAFARPKPVRSQSGREAGERASCAGLVNKTTRCSTYQSQVKHKGNKYAGKQMPKPVTTHCRR